MKTGNDQKHKRVIMKIKSIILIKLISSSILLATLLILASCNGSQENIGEENKSSVSKTKPEPPSTDIHTAAFLGNLKAVEQHIAAGTDLNIKDNYGSSPLIIAITFGKTETAIALIKGGADLNLTNNDGSTPLHIAAFFCRTEVVEALINSGTDKTIKNKFGATALQSVLMPFDSVKFIYDQISKQLGPVGLKLDYEHLEMTRPIVAEMLQ
jgi:uncharacterized protein